MGTRNILHLCYNILSINSLYVHSVGSVFFRKRFFSFFLSSSVLAKYGKFRDNQQVIEVKHVMIKNYRDNCTVRLN